MRKELVALALAGLYTSTNAFGVEDTIEVIAGIMDGIIQADDLTILEQCLTNVDTLTDEIEVAVADFEKLSFDGIVAGIEEVGTILLQLPSDLKDCTAIMSDLDKLMAWADIFLHPVELMKRLAVNVPKNLLTITRDAKEAIKDWNNADYFDFGDEIGTILVLAIGSDPATVEAPLQ